MVVGLFGRVVQAEGWRPAGKAVRDHSPASVPHGRRRLWECRRVGVRRRGGDLSAAKRGARSSSQLSSLPSYVSVIVVSNGFSPEIVAED